MISTFAWVCSRLRPHQLSLMRRWQTYCVNFRGRIAALFISFDLYCSIFKDKTVQKWSETPHCKKNVFSFKITFAELNVWSTQVNDACGLLTSGWICPNLMGSSITWVNPISLNKLIYSLVWSCFPKG